MIFFTFKSFKKNRNSASLRNVRFSINTIFLVLQVTFILKPTSNFNCYEILDFKLK